MVFKAGEQGHQALPPAADGRQVQQADGLEAVLDGSRTAAAVDSDQHASVAGGAWQHRGGCQADVFCSLPRAKRGSLQHASYAYIGHLSSRGHVYSVACYGVVRFIMENGAKGCRVFHCFRQTCLSCVTLPIGPSPTCLSHPLNENHK